MLAACSFSHMRTCIKRSIDGEVRLFTGPTLAIISGYRAPTADELAKEASNLAGRATKKYYVAKI